MTIERIERKTGWIYAIIWIVIITLYLLHIASDHGEAGSYRISPNELMHCVRMLVPLFLLFLINNYLLIPVLLFRGRLGLYVASVIFSVGIVFLYQYQVYLSMPMPGPPPGPHVLGPGDLHHPHHLFPMPLLNGLFLSFLVVGLNLAIALTSRQMQISIENQRLVAANNADRLQHLKTQINPHFYMNMLNSIHGMIDIDPEKAKDMVFDMSQLMQYMLYDSAHERIRLSAEVKFLEDYLHIMRQRFPESKVKIRSVFPDTLVAARYEVPPLLFLVFIENAFKHGIDYRRHSYVDVSLSVRDDTILFSCVNSLQPSNPSSMRGTSGIGLRNIRTRLELIYGRRAELELGQNENSYTVKLSIPAYEIKNADN